MRTKFLFVVFLGVSMVGRLGTSQEVPDRVRIRLVAESGQGIKAVMPLRANVLARDLAARRLTLAGVDGEALIMQVAPGACDLGFIAVGDTVTVRYIRPLALRFRPMRAPALAAPTLPEARISISGLTARTLDVPVRHLEVVLRTVDLQARTAILEDDAGISFPVGIPHEAIGLDHVNFGRRIAVDVTAATIVALDSHEPAGTLHREEHLGGGDSSGPDWSYRGEKGPEHWGDLAPEYSLCKTGELQSPIDLHRRESRWPSPPLAFTYRDVPLDLVNDGRSIVMRMPGGGTLRVGKKTFQLFEIRIHSPSEHTIDGKALPLEFQLFHRDENGRVLLVAVLAKKGNANPLLASFWARLPKAKGDAVSDPAVLLNPRGLLPRDRSHFYYKGSLSMPPCSEDVEWMVMVKAISCSRAQIAAFRAIHRNNVRPVQPRHGRKVGLRWSR